jgi:hypothetical protein
MMVLPSGLISTEVQVPSDVFKSNILEAFKGRFLYFVNAVSFWAKSEIENRSKNNIDPRSLNDFI